MSLFVAGAALGEVQVSLFVAGAALGEVQVSLFVAMVICAILISNLEVGKCGILISNI